jgi:hypothetical protein
VRATSRIFAAIGVFALIAGLVLTLGYGPDGPDSDGSRLQAAVILGVFGLASLYLAFALRPQGLRELDGLVLHEAHEAGEDVHLPPPSLFPALYGVVGVLVLVGLVTSYEIAIAGVVLLVITTVGWARESVVEYRREIAHAPHGADETYSPATIEAAHKVQAFARAHHGADAIVQHLGQRRAEIVVVGKDGTWGSIACPSFDDARAAVPLAGVALHETWPAGVGSRIGADMDLWSRMAGESAPRIHHGPRDGTTQVGARIFLPIGVFGLVAAGLYVLGYAGKGITGTRVQGGSILVVFFVACFYLFIALRNAKGAPEDHVWADESGVAREPTEPDPPVDLETLHLPGPSIWPAVFSVAGAVLVLGLVFQLTIALVGVALLVLSSIGWAVESVREYRAMTAHSTAGHGGVSDHTVATH